MATATVAQRTNPFVGPRSFQKNELLYGRDRELRQLFNLLIAERIVLFYSPSGAGKTSLIQAKDGLMDAMEREGFAVRPMMRVSLIDKLIDKMERVGFAPSPLLHDPSVNRYVLSGLSCLEEALPEAGRQACEVLAATTFESYLNEHSVTDEMHPNELLIFDQFEEILTSDPTDQAVKAEFFAQVGAALRNGRRWALFSMREDYVAGLDPYLRPIPTRLHTTYRLDLLGEHAARQAIQRPAQNAGIDFTDSAAQKLVNNLRLVRVQSPDGTEIEEKPGPYVEPVQLQVVCRNLWEKLPPGATRITDSDVTNIGDVDKALADYYATSVAAAASQTGTSEREIREWIQDQLITEQGIRTQVLEGSAGSQHLEGIIKRLVTAHLLRVEDRRGTKWFELAHDRLVKPVREDNKHWFAATLSPLQREAKLWQEQNRPNGLLLRGSALKEGVRWGEEHVGELTTSEADFLAESQNLRQRTKRERRLSISAFGAIGLALAVLWFAGWYVVRSYRQTDKLLNEALVAKWESQTGVLSSRFMTHANQEEVRAEMVQVQEEIRNARLQVKRAKADAKAIVQSALKLSTDLQQEVDLAKSTHRGTKALLLTVEALRANPDNDLSASLESDFRTMMANVGGPIMRRPGKETSDMAISPDRQWLATVLTGADSVCEAPTSGSLWRLGSKDKSVIPLQDACGPVIITSNSHWLITGSVDSAVRVWDLTSMSQGLQSIPLGTGERLERSLEPVYVSDDGNEIIARTNNGLLSWNLGKGSQLERKGRPVKGDFLKLSQDGHWLLTIDRGSLSGTTCTSRLHLWNLLAPMAPALALSENIFGAIGSFSDDGRWVVTAGYCPPKKDAATTSTEVAHSASVKVFDLLKAANGAVSGTELPGIPEGKEPKQPQGAFDLSGAVITISSDGTRVAMANPGGLRIWDNVADPSVSPSFYRLDDWSIDSVAFSLDNQWIFVAGDRMWYLKDEDSSNKPFQLLRDELPRGCVSHPPKQGRWFHAICGNTVIVVDLMEKDPLETARILTNPEASTEVESWDIEPHAAVTKDRSGIIRFWDLRPTIPISNPLIYAGPNSVSADGRYFAVGQPDGSMLLFDLSIPAPYRHPIELKGQGSSISAMAFSPKGNLLAVSRSSSLELWRLDSATYEYVLLNVDNNPVRAGKLWFAPDNNWLVLKQQTNFSLLSVNNKYEQRIQQGTPIFSRNPGWVFMLPSPMPTSLPLREMSLLRLYPDRADTIALERPHLEGGGNVGRILNAQFSPKGRWFIVRFASGSWMWDLASQRTYEITGHPISTTFSDDDHWLYANSGVEGQLWDLSVSAAPMKISNEVISCAAQQGSTVHACVDAGFSPKNTWLITSSKSESGVQTRILNLKDRTSELLLHSEATFSFSKSEHWLFLHSEEGDFLWDLNSRLQKPLKLGIAHGAERMATFSEDEQWLLAFPRLWHLKSRQAADAINPVYLPTSLQPAEATISVNDAWIIGRTSDRIGIWSTRLEDLVVAACRIPSSNLSVSDWNSYFPGKPYRPTCTAAASPDSSDILEPAGKSASQGKKDR